MSCPCCEWEKAREYYREQEQPLWQCERCGTLFFERTPDLGPHNDPGYFDANKVRLWRNWLQRQVRIPFSPQNWLDFGAGFGEFSAALQALYPDLKVAAYEPDPVRQQQWKAPVPLMLNWEEQQWDCISLMQVWSHLPDPLHTLRQLNQALRTGGYVLLQTGNAASLRPEQYPNKYFPGRHFQFGNGAILSQMAAKTGFTVRAYWQEPYPELSPRNLLGSLLRRRSYTFRHWRGAYQNCQFWLQKA